MKAVVYVLKAVFLTCAVTSFAQGVKGPEAAMVASVDRNAAANVELLRQLVEINSGTMNFEGVRAVSDVLEPKFKGLGFTTKWVTMDAVNRAGHLIAEHPCAKAGGCGKRILVIGHMDTVFDKGSPFQHWSVSGDTATGPGTNDMKGGLVILLSSLQAMQDAGVLQGAAITVVLDGDEEAHGTPATVSRRDLVEAAKRSDVALEFEATARQKGEYYGSISRRSSSSWKLTTTGNTGHSSGVFSENMGYGAIYELTRILDAFRRELPEKYLTFNVGTIAGGSRTEAAPGGGTIAFGKSNIVPPVATATGDLRTISDEQTERIQTKMRAIVAQHLPKTGAEISFEEGYPAMPPTEASRALLHTLNQVNKTLGAAEMPELDPLLRGAGDISFMASLLPGLAGVGATGEGSHAPGETVDLPSQVLNAKRDALLMYRLSLEK
ncbi:M20/M25/M40 family metallo-hydrolase [Terriglobus saanensis]|uniref:Peptidase dimerization domain protein n=1 Tax=Terriglobus saanensis (strain ATCC BAA-1853 / DSM 23119 / SP1PR4) TaxID=401053 RepID=E8V0L7_TERSS|nr:M20/M25/M40 family metallo-hydrolase [Terriglobus saanensis]ADV81080.1 peptidase dimerization domain protein [Terriglobus saanensis SP1PR4]